MSNPNTGEEPSNMAASVPNNNGTPTTPVQVVKPTVRPDKEASSSTCPKMPDTFSFVPIGLSTTNKLSTKEHPAGENSITCTANEAATEEAEPQGNPAEEDAEFEWNDYLDSADAIAAPPILFPHVENSLQNLFTPNMKLEVPNRHLDDTFWVASVIMPCGPLLRLRYEGYGSDRSADFWCEIASGEIHPVGWSHENKKSLKPPPAIRHKHEDWDEFLRKALDGATTIPSYLLQASGSTAIDQIKQGMKLEIQEKLNPTHLWIATVIENVGGRLLLRYDGIYTSFCDFWVFYLSYRVHPVGWVKNNPGHEYSPPSVGQPASSQDWDAVLQESLGEAEKLPVPAVIFKTQEKIEPHNFQEGMKLEMLSSSTLLQICPATVTKVLSPLYFLVEADQSHPSVCESRGHPVACHAKSSIIFPPGWAKLNGLTVTFPRESEKNQPEIDWEDHLDNLALESDGKRPEMAPTELFSMLPTKSDEEEEGFEAGMKLEAANPFYPNQICAATVEKVTGHLLWIKLDNLLGVHPNHIVPVNSLEIFPVGWCDSNHYPLKIPLAYQQGIKRSPTKKVAIVMPKKQSSKPDGGDDDYGFTKDVRELQATGKAWCPEIYVNHKCFSGPFLSKARIAGLPRHVGPGPVTLVLKEVISMIVGVSYISGRALGILQAQGEPTPGMQQQLIKAKCKLKTYRAMVEIIRSSDKVEEYCRSVCRKLQCCPNLFGPNFYGDNCPENCYTLTKTNPNNALKRRKKRRKNKTLAAKLLRAQQQKSPSPDKDEDKMDEENNNTNSNEDKDDEENEESKPKKRKYVHRTVPKSDIVTRGAKLPNFALELRRQHRKSAAFGYISGLGKSGGSHHRHGSDGKLKSASGDSQVGQAVHDILQLDSNPLQWSVEEVAKFIQNTDCSQMIRLLREQEIDGQALLLLTLPTIQEHLELKLGPAIKLCHQIERVKIAFYAQFAN